ncbi:hypothetical protein Skr01_30620 [Sphaerisporangium krabiense]|uniref:DUF4115 domain-containing protein n=1 Tax=Sphaerisporangium krabiense TaxID=763782 RepID=A0A7W9DNT7_9ACTN|nr:hypothetical protein [Sphaerisporangium krabiense]MBB5625687.1 hypothetical protein [Sphaerisporangium krabiense]GII62977.1 hypothetical protein Skr01_30620 [Sphaerisporangium krabiense]
MGIARLLLVGVAILVVLGLVVLGAVALIGSLSSDGDGGTPTAPPATTPLVTAPASPTLAEEDSSGDLPTLYVECRADRCPIFVRVSGGDIVEDRELTRGQQAMYSQPRLDVVLADASTLYVEVNGRARPPAKPGERQSFIADRFK